MPSEKRPTQGNMSVDSKTNNIRWPLKSWFRSQDLLLSGKYSDFTVIVNDEKFYLHKDLLIKKSGYFRSFFSWSISTDLVEPTFHKFDTQDNPITGDSFALFVESWYLCEPVKFFPPEEEANITRVIEYGCFLHDTAKFLLAEPLRFRLPDFRPLFKDVVYKDLVLKRNNGESVEFESESDDNHWHEHRFWHYPKDKKYDALMEFIGKTVKISPYIISWFIIEDLRCTGTTTFSPDDLIELTDSADFDIHNRDNTLYRVHVTVNDANSPKNEILFTSKIYVVESLTAGFSLGNVLCDLIESIIERVLDQYRDTP